MSLRKRWPALLLVLLPILWWWPMLMGSLPDFMDTVTQLYPMRVAVARQLHAGTLPLWLPEMLCGTPLAADPQVAAWYPPQWLFFLWPTPVANGLVCLFHYLLAGFGMYALARRFGLGRASAYFGAFTFQFSPFLVSHLALTPHLYTVPWIPWILLAAERSVRSKAGDWRGAALVGVAFAMQVLAGAPQVSFYTGILLAIYWSVRVAQVRGSGGAARRAVRLVAGGALALVLTLALAGIQLVPSAEFLRQTERHGIDLARLQDSALRGEYCWRAIVGWTGNPIEDTDTVNAIGLGALALVPLAFWRRRLRGQAVLLLALGVLFYLLALAALVPFWAKVLPLYGNLNAPRRAFMIWSVLGPLLAAMGAESLRAMLQRHAIGATLHGAALGLLACGTLGMLHRLEREFTSPERFDVIPEYRELIGDSRFFTIDPTFRYSYDSRRYDYGDSLMANLGAWHGMYDAQGYNPLVLRRFGRLREATSQPSGSLYPSHGCFLTDPAAPALKLLAVQFLVGRYDLFNPSRIIEGARMDPKTVDPLVEQASGRSWRWPLFRYREHRPLAWAVERSREVPDEESALAAAVATDPYREAFVESPAEGFDFGPAPKVEVERRDGRTFAVKLAPTATGAFVLVSTTWMPGWRAVAADGSRLETMPADGVLVGVLVPPGVSEFSLVYAPRSFRDGALLTLAGLLGVLICFYRCKR